MVIRVDQIGVRLLICSPSYTRKEQVVDQKHMQWILGVQAWF